MKLEEIKKCKYGYTHGASFHSDDVFSAAFLQIINPDIIIKRVLDVNGCDDGIIFDIGMGEFDHHMKDNEVRENGVPYASFGKLWRAFASELYGEEICKKIDSLFIQDLDLTDNTGKKDSLALAIASFNPVVISDNGDKEFMEAVEFAKRILTNLINKCLARLKDKDKVLEYYEKSKDKRIVILDEYLHFQDYLPATEAVYVIYPSKRKGYSARAITINTETIELKKAFPKEWVDKQPDYLTFCHNSRFLISGKTLEDVVRACEESLKW